MRASNNQIFHYGDSLRLRGKLKTPPENEDFSYRDYLAAQHIHSYMSSAEVTVLPGKGGNPVSAPLYAIKEKSLANIYRMFPDPESSLMAGILLGVDTGLTQELQHAFKNTGTAHIIAISGFNISIIAGMFVVFFSRFLGERRGAVIAILGIILYTVLVGGGRGGCARRNYGKSGVICQTGGPSSVRAEHTSGGCFVDVFMESVIYLGCWFSTFVFCYTWSYSLCRSIFEICQWDHYEIFSSLHGGTFAELFSEFVLLTLAAQLTTIPIMAYHFQRISLVSFIANPFILPAQPAVMIIGGLAVLLSLVWLPLGQIAAWVAWPFVVYTIRMVELFDRVPHGTIFLGKFSIWFVILFYAALFSVTFGGAQLKEWFQSVKRDQIKDPRGNRAHRPDVGLVAGLARGSRNSG